MQIKKGVNIDGVHIAMHRAMGFVCAVIPLIAPNKTAVITSGKDGQHRQDSKHYSGCAIDIRTRDLSDVQARHVVSIMRRILDPQGYDTVLEDDHIHCEYDPKPGDQFATIVD